MGLLTTSIQISGDTTIDVPPIITAIHSTIDTISSAEYDTSIPNERAVVDYIVYTYYYAETSNDVSLSTALSTEKSTRGTADTSLSTAISTANSVRASADTSLSTAISSVGGGSTTSLSTAISTEISTRGTADTSLSTAISTANSTRSSADTSLSTAVSTANSTRSSADSSLATGISTAVSTEASTRGSVDTSLSTAVSTANSTRSSVDTSLSTAISSTNSTVSSADSSLATSINNLSVAPSKFLYGTNGSGSNTASVTQNLLELPQYKAGFWEVNGASWTPNTGWFWGLTMAHTSNTSSYNYGTQIISDYANSGYLYTRTISGGASPSASSWFKMWTEANDGHSSGLDADLWDGNQFSSYLNQALLTTSTPSFAGLTVNGTSNLDAISLGGTITPSTTNSYNLGSSSSVFASGYFTNVYSSTRFFGADGSSTTPSYSFTNFNGYGLFAASGYIGMTFATSTDYFRFTSAGVFHAESDIIAYSSTVPSDNRLKENVKNIDNGLSIIDQLNPVSFTWKDPKKALKGVVYGLIAQDVEKILPEIVKEHNILGKPDDEFYKTVNYEQIIPFLIKSIKELKEEIDILKNK
jgi:hypothetical protein